MSKALVAFFSAGGVTAGVAKKLSEPYVPHPVVGAIDQNPPQGVILLDEKK